MGNLKEKNKKKADFRQLFVLFRGRFFFADQNGRGFDLCGCSHENSSLLPPL